MPTLMPTIRWCHGSHSSRDQDGSNKKWFSRLNSAALLQGRDSKVMSPYRDHSAKMSPYSQRSSQSALQWSHYGSQVSPVPERYLSSTTWFAFVTSSIAALCLPSHRSGSCCQVIHGRLCRRQYYCCELCLLQCFTLLSAGEAKDHLASHQRACLLRQDTALAQALCRHLSSSPGALADALQLKLCSLSAGLRVLWERLDGMFWKQRRCASPFHAVKKHPLRVWQYC